MKELIYKVAHGIRPHLSTVATPHVFAHGIVPEPIDNEPIVELSLQPSERALFTVYGRQRRELARLIQAAYEASDPIVRFLHGPDGEAYEQKIRADIGIPHDSLAFGKDADKSGNDVYDNEWPVFVRFENGHGLHILLDRRKRPFYAAYSNSEGIAVRQTKDEYYVRIQNGLETTIKDEDGNDAILGSEALADLLLELQSEADAFGKSHNLQDGTIGLEIDMIGAMEHVHRDTRGLNSGGATIVARTPIDIETWYEAHRPDRHWDVPIRDSAFIDNAVTHFSSRATEGLRKAFAAPRSR